MIAKTNYWKLGFFVLVGTVVGVGAIFWFGATRLARETIELYAYFDEPVSGLEEGSSIKFRGVTIGRVAGIATAPDRRHVEIKAEVFTSALERLGLRDAARPQRFGEGLFMPPDLRVQLVSSVLTGLTYVQSDFVDTSKHPVPKYPFEVPWNTIHSVPSTHKSVEIGITRLIEQLPPLAEQLTSFLARVERALDQAQVKKLSERADSLMRTAESELQHIRESGILERGTKALVEAENAVQDIRALAADLRKKDGPVHKAADRIEALGLRLEKAVGDADVAATVESMQRMGKALASAADEIQVLGRDLRREVAGLGETLAAVRRLADLLERDPGALMHGRSPVSSPAQKRGKK